MELGVMGNTIGDSATAKPNTAETGHLGIREQGVGTEEVSNEFSDLPRDRGRRSQPVVTPRISSNKYDAPSTQAKILLVSKGKDSRPKLSLLPNIFDGVVDGTLRVAGISSRPATKTSMINSTTTNKSNPTVALTNQTSDTSEQNVNAKDGQVITATTKIPVQSGQTDLVNNSSANTGSVGVISHGTPGGCSQGSTSTPGLDDGYGSSNSSPHSSGRHKPSKHGSANTLLFHKKEMLVQVEEDSCVVQSLIIEGSQSSGESRGSAPGSPSSLTEGDVKSVVLDGAIPKDHVDDGRETWGTGADFLLSIIGFAVDLANVWRFPYLCYKNGGGAFLIPYTLMLVFGALPLFYMELILGQFNRQGPISLWKICPLFKGVGFCAVMVAFYVSFYYNVIIGWSLYFLVSSATSELPWIHCNNTWNSEGCWDSSMAKLLNDTITNITAPPGNETHGPLNKFSPASEFFHRSVLEIQRSAGLHDLGLPKWQLVLCLLTVYTMLYLSLFKGVKSSGKVVWATATLPYVVLSLLLARGLLLPGASTGIAYYLSPQLSRLSDVQVWVDAAVQIFYSVGAGFGVHLSYASYNTFHNNCYRDCLVTTAVNCFTSFFSGFVIFTYLGFMSHKQGVPISSVATEGPGLVFQVYPEAIATLPGAHIWSMLFFFMLIMLGLDSGMGGLECVITGLMDEFKGVFKNVKYAREKFTLCAVGFSFCVACFNVTPGGIYMFHLLDTYSAGISLLCSALFEAVAISWFYGLEKFTNDVEAMLGFRPGPYWRICWKFISPSFIIGVVTFGLLFHQPLSYQQYSYPWWAEVLGWSLALSSVLMIPAVAIYQLCVTKGTFKERFALCISPPEEQEEIKNTKVVKRFTLRHWLYV